MNAPSAHPLRRLIPACAPGWLRLAVVSAFAVTAGAATMLEDFSYANGSAVAGQGGGTGWSGAWSAIAGNGTILAENGSLTYPGLVSSGGRMVFTGIPATGTSTNTFRILGTPLTEGSTTYLSFLGQNLNEGRRFFGLGLFDGATERMLFGQGSLFGNWTANHVAGFPVTANVLDSGVDSSAVALLVFKLELLAGVERITFWVNPDLSQPETLASAAGGTSHLTDIDFLQITRVRIGGGGFSASAGGDPTNHNMDEIRIDSVSPFAVPEPTALAGVLVGTLLCSARNRRRERSSQGGSRLA
jgi:hypothetical protein